MSERGSMMMEYVLLQALIAALLLGEWSWSVYDYSSGLGATGKMIQGFFQRILGGLSLPVP